MKGTISSVKEGASITVDMLTKLLGQVKELKKRPEEMVKKSVHGRIIARGDGGEDKALVDKKGDRPMGRPTGEY